MKLQNSAITSKNSEWLVFTCSVLVFIISSTVLAGWFFNLPTLVRIKPSWVPMVFNTAVLCFFSSLAIGLTTFAFSYATLLFQRVVAFCVFLTASLTMLQVLFGMDFNIDLPELHRPLQIDYVHPGRMAFNTTLAFVLFGLGLLIDSFRFSKRENLKRIVQALAILVILVGWLGLLSYWINLDYLYNWTSNVRMAVPSAVTIILLGLALFNLPGHLDHKTPSVNASKIYIISAFAITMICLTTGLSAFAILAQRTHEVISNHLQQMALDRRFFFQKDLWSQSEQAILLSKTPSLSLVLNGLNKNPSDIRFKDALVSISSHLKRDEFTAITFEGLNHEQWPGFGKLSKSKYPPIPFEGPYSGLLIWDAGYKLHSHIPVFDGSYIVGYMLVEQRLKTLNELRESHILKYLSRDMVICGKDESYYNCFPSDSDDKPFRIKRVEENQSLPIGKALELKEAGSMTTLDYNGDRVLAAYGPIDETGLGMVIKVDITEIYSPIKEQLYKAIWFMLGLLALGLVLVHRNLVPLIRRIDSARRQAEQENARFVAATEGSFDSFYIFDSIRDERNQIVDLRCSYVNQRGAELISRKPEDFIGKRLFEELPFTRGPMYFDRFKYVIESGESITDELQMDDQEVEASWIARQIVKLGDGVAITLRDISKQKKNESYMHHIAMHDALTGLPNRALFEDRIKITIEQAKRDNTQVAVALIDLDYFKQVNDTLGHHAGDALLQELTARLSLNIRPSDTLARLGGDEFALILPKIEHPTNSSLVLSKLFKVLQQPIYAAGHKINVGISVGIAAYPNDGAELGILMRHADEAMYEAKAAGRNNFQIYKASTFKAPDTKA